MRRYFRQRVSCLLVAAVSLTTPLTALASPEFAYSAEKWATLRDDNLDFDEIADLVHEYNTTVVQNRITWQDEKDDDSDDVAQDYYDAADNIYNNITYPDDSDSSSYGSQMAAAVQNKIQADNLMEQGDESTDDNVTKKLNYDKQEAQLVKQAQELMISYWSQYYSMDTTREQKTQAEKDLAAEETRLAAGTSTQSSVLTARNAVSTAEASILSAESNLSSTKENLCLMLGWSYGADVNIGELPEPDLEMIDAIDLATDIESALANNYDFQITQKQVTNARSTTKKATLTQQEANERQAISNNVSDSYSDLILARSSYEQALAAFELQKSTYETAARQLQAGTISQNTYNNQQTSYVNAEVTVRTRKLELLTAMIDYQWNVAGLASTS
ncbi:MAG: TolC family protein [Clostridiales bacterium]|nr:TolC family protein [Clostridiales bacterium]